MTKIVTSNLILAQKNLQIKDEIIEVDNPPEFKWVLVYSNLQKQIKDIKNKYVIKVNLVKSTKYKLYFHVIYLVGFKGFIDEPFMPTVGAGFQPAPMRDITCLIVPTGIGASIGGYAGDANPLAKLFSLTNKYLLTHPNVVNGSVLSDLPQNIIYLEGFLLDLFLIGKINIIPNNQNKIGVIFDKSINEKRLEYEINVLNALKAFYGCNIVGWIQTKKCLDIVPSISKYGFSSGKIENLEYVIESAIKLKEKGTTAIAICTQMPDSKLNKGYVLGKGVDPIGGIEAIISHAVSAATGLVSAHAPVLTDLEEVNLSTISPVSASEYIAKTFLPSVVNGLRFAPKIGNSRSFTNVAKIVCPCNAFGSPGVFYSNEIFGNVTLVRENKSCLDVNARDFDIDFKIANSYVDLIDKKMIESAGIDVSVLERPLKSVKNILSN